MGGRTSWSIEPAVHWVNHAGFVVRNAGIRLITDPWFEGRAFDDSWELLSPTQMAYSDFGAITHLWISHEHPDHFSPPTLKRIPEEHRRNLTVLHQHNPDRRVVDYCARLGFKDVIELPHEERVTLTPGFDITCGREASSGDSWLHVRTGGSSLLNINDCVYLQDADLEHIREVVGEVGVLFTQFSYAVWAGNPGDRDQRQRLARGMLEKVRRETAILRPRQVVPCASFVVFCHEENFHMNVDANTIDVACGFIRDRTQAEPVALYPGDTWWPGDQHHSDDALARYRVDLDRAIDAGPTVKTAPIEFARLESEAQSMTSRLRKQNSRLMTMRIPPALVHVRDLGVTCRLSMAGLQRVEPGNRTADISLTSGAFLYCLAKPWGGSTLKIDGRYIVPPGLTPGDWST